MKHAGIYKKGELSFADVLQDVRNSSEFRLAGGIGVFIGVVRGRSLEGHRVVRMEVDSYEEKAESVLSTICTELAKGEGIADVRIYHILGEFEPGDDLVYVIVAGAHRNEIFKVLREAVERYKHEAPFFKKEHLVDKETGETVERWVEEFSPK
ncbi:MAG: molybdenum cofactor biosynthesis protein MoaE [Promethearchaeati archaeon SRVP18_Atabeyarchaeia-1]